MFCSCGSNLFTCMAAYDPDDIRSMDRKSRGIMAVDRSYSFPMLDGGSGHFIEAGWGGQQSIYVGATERAIISHKVLARTWECIRFMAHLCCFKHGNSISKAPTKAAIGATLARMIAKQSAAKVAIFFSIPDFTQGLLRGVSQGETVIAAH